MITEYKIPHINNSRILLWVSAMCFSLFSCHNDIDVEEVRHSYTETQKQIRTKFTDRFGEVSASHSWMNIDECRLTVEMPAGTLSSDCLARIYTTDPRQDRTDCYILAEKKGLKAGTDCEIAYDAPIGLKYVYVVVTDGNNSYVVRATNGKDSKVVLSSNDLYGSRLNDKAMEYILCYETILTKDSVYTDFDYNDVVISLEYVRGRDHANVRLCAAGSNEAVCVDFVRSNRQTLGKGDETLFEECHTSFGMPPFYSYMDKKDIYYELNTGRYQMTNKPSYKLSLDEFQDCSAKEVISRLFVSFKSGKDNKTVNTYFIEPENGSSMPTGICVPQPVWSWSKEGVSIDKHCINFADWIKDSRENPFWYDATWLIANNREHDNPADNSPYGEELDIVDSYITAEQFSAYERYSCTLAIKVSNVKSPGTLRLCKYKDTPILFVRDISVITAGIYEVELTPSDIYKIMEEETTGLSGLQLIYEGFEVDGVFIR